MLKKLLKIFLWGVGSLVLIFVLFNIFYKYQLQDSQSPKIYDKNGILLYDVRGGGGRQNVYSTFDEIPQFIKDIAIFREDKRFYSHFGVDILALSRALYVDLKAMKFKQGGSTIDMQTIKLSQLAYKRTLLQKIEEVFLAMNINFHYSKQDILTYYINNLPLGNGIRGMRTGCNYYFGKDCTSLSKGELVYLFHISKYGRLANYSKGAYEFAQQYGLKEYTLNDFKKIHKSIGFHIDKKAPQFVDYILSKGLNNTIKTKFDYNLYMDIQSQLLSLKSYLGGIDVDDSCVLVLDKKGDIISMNLLREYGNKEYGYVNGCTSPRQVGSSMKPFLYTFAFDSLEYTPTDTIVDEPVTYFLENGGKYEPKNFSLKYHGVVPLEKALGSSLNIPSVKLLDKVGLPQYWNFLHKISSMVGTKEQWKDEYSNYGLSLALGTKEISPLDFAKMWTMFLGNYDNSFGEKYGDDISTIKSIISKNENRLLSFEINNWLNVPGTFAKTGTSRHFVDGWACGGYVDKDYILCVWSGNYDASPMKKSGIMSSGVVWNHIIKILENY